MLDALVEAELKDRVSSVIKEWNENNYFILKPD